MISVTSRLSQLPPIHPDIILFKICRMSHVFTSRYIPSSKNTFAVNIAFFHTPRLLLARLGAKGNISPRGFLNQR
jgi:hypothetical protein